MHDRYREAAIGSARVISTVQHPEGHAHVQIRDRRGRQWARGLSDNDLQQLENKNTQREDQMAGLSYFYLHKYFFNYYVQVWNFMDLAPSSGRHMYYIKRQFISAVALERFHVNMRARVQQNSHVYKIKTKDFSLDLKTNYNLN